MSLKQHRMNFKEATNTLLATVKLEELCERLGVETQRTGTSVKALCQFHKDTKPSMELYDNNLEKPAFHCFSCGAHGDIFALVKEVKGMDFRESHNWLCDEYNFKIDRPRVTKSSKTHEPFDDVTVNVYQYALDFYSKYQNEIEFKAFLTERGYSHEFGCKVGLCLADGSSLVRHLDNLHYPEHTHKLYVFDKYESAGLIRKEKERYNFNKTQSLKLENLYYDHFRNKRLLFPIKSQTGEVQGIAGRLTNINKGPKYLFSKGMDKSKLLYRSESAFYNVERSTEEKIPLFVCEGLFDALRLESLGLNAVAVLGASLSDNQCELLIGVARAITNKNKVLELNLFFDNDQSGVKATDLSIKKIITKLGLDNVDIKVYHSKDKGKVDPDSFLKGREENALELLSSIEYPFPAINLSQELNISILEVEDNKFFKDLPYSLKIRASKKWHDIFKGSQSSIVLDEFESKFGECDWFKLLINYDSDNSKVIKNNQDTFISDTKQRLHLAFSISKSSMSNTGMFPDNDAEWRRVEMCLPLLEDILTDRFSKYNKDLQPIEPLNTIYVSREISGAEHREMSMHCVEDLTSHQHVLSDLLTERCDYVDNFSLNIPAARYYRKSNTTITTGEGGKSEYNQTLSFAYQIDMEVVEGREVPGSDGMFRPYFQCWKEFTRSINKAASQMNQVNMVRLDLKRYYDRLKRYVVQDALRECIPDDLSIYEDQNLLHLVQDDGGGKKSKIIDWLLEQSFGYKKYDPKTGEVKESDPYVGIPQGPDISSFLANLVLFKVDGEARKFLENNKDPETERYTAWYARYVDDMVLIAEDSSTLSRLRIVIEEAVRKLELELVAKEQPAAMTAEEFEVYLTQGKALASSGPTGNVELVNIDDINFVGRIERYQALSLLNNKDLYSDDISTIKAKINMAMHCTELRFSDIKKVAKWVWFVAAQETNINSAKEMVSNYQKLWAEVTSNMQKQLLPKECPWEDPLLLSFDGLNQVISRSNIWVNDSLSQQDILEKEKVRKKLIGLINISLIPCLVDYNPHKILGWGVSKTELARTYWQKSISLLWHAKQYDGVKFDDKAHLNILSSLRDEHTLRVSLVRTYLTELQCKSSFNYETLESSYGNDFRNLCILLQVLYLLLSKSSSETDSDVDILSPILGGIKRFVRGLNDNYLSKNIFTLFIPDGEILLVPENKEFSIKVLYFVCSLTSNTKLISILSSRWNGLLNGTFENVKYNLITPLPAIEEHALYGYHLDDNNQIKALMKASTNESSESDVIYISNTEGLNFTDWKSVDNKAKGLHVAITDGSVLKEAINIFQSPPPIVTEISKDVLSWTASTYRSLIKCADEGSKIPTWCNTSMSRFPSQDGYFKENNVCIISSKDRITSFPQAFIRNGGKSLRPIQIPNHNVRFWQAGVALTDMLGFTRDLDVYANVDEALDGHNEPPQVRLLKNSLKKLNGSIYFSKPVLALEGEIIPKSIQRTLALLDYFPNTGNTSDDYLFGFISEMESQIMRIRLGNYSNPTENGKLLQVYAEALKACLARVPLEWFSHFPHKPLEQSTGLRISERFWIVLHGVFDQAIKESRFDNDIADLETIQKAILLGCQINLIETSLKAVVFESQANSVIDPKEFEGIELDESLPFDFFSSDFSLNKYCLYDGSEESSIETLGRYFCRLLKDKAQQSAFGAITPLGWLLIALVKKGLIKKGSQNLDRIQNEALKKLAQSNLVKLLSLESSTSSCGEWPVEHDVTVYDIGSIVNDLRQVHSVESVTLIDVESEHFSYDSVKGEFKNLWKLKKWQIDVSASSSKDSKPFYEAKDNRLLSSWTETYNGDNLLHISSLGRLYGGILQQVSGSSFVKQKDSDAVNATEEDLGVVNTAEEDLGVVNAAEEDLVAVNATEEDLGVVNATEEDLGVVNAAEEDLVAVNATEEDLGVVNATEEDLGVVNTAEEDLGVVNAAEEDLVAVNATEEDLGVVNAAEEDLVTVNATEEDLGVVNTAEEDLGVVNTAEEDLGVVNTAEEDLVTVNVAGEQTSSGEVPRFTPIRSGALEQGDFELNKVLERVTRMHVHSWGIRKDSRAPSHTRIAMFQMDLKGEYGDGYYTHYSKNEELLDSCILGVRCKEVRDELCNDTLSKTIRAQLIDELQGCQSDDECSNLYEQLTKYNAAETRRRALLKGVVESCIRLNVDLLVLPEYSVQPATIVWLKDLLKGKYISVLAGTYRLPEGYPRAKLKELTSSEYSAQVSSFQSVMTLLVPYQEDKVLCFNRAKKYASPAANELINPYQYKIDPLFSLEMFEKHLLSDFSGTALGLKDIVALMKTRHISSLGFIQELICAELFLLTNPVNYLNLASEYKNLSNKFGFFKSGSDDEAVNAVLDDIKNIAFNLSGDTGTQIAGFQPYKRSIVTIPAMTTRKQDYWIFGQGAMLANGISTVFCNAVNGKESTGGSCFIGLDSWVGDETKPFITPYNGWTKGIYYGDKSDTLQNEQSLVVVDIDPKMMSLGSPRPQALPVPMKLVAHIPVIELSSIDNDNIRKLKIFLSAFEEFHLKHKANKIIDPKLADSLTEKLQNWFDISCGKDQKESLQARLDNWKQKWRISPQVDIAALTDWLVVNSLQPVKGKSDA
jgi:DNA primase catalytic core